MGVYISDRWFIKIKVKEKMRKFIYSFFILYGREKEGSNLNIVLIFKVNMFEIIKL